MQATARRVSASVIQILILDLKYPPQSESIVQKRIRAGVCFLYLTGMRISAFISMPIKAVNLKELEVRQSPELGMRTKNKKSAITYMLDIGPVIHYVCEWDAFVRHKLPPSGFWFTPLNSTTGYINTSAVKVGENRPSIFRKDLTTWLNKHQTLLHSPHDFRRGHASFLWERSKDFNDLLAIKENLMQENLATTELYARKNKAQIKSLVHNLMKKSVTQEPGQDVNSQLHVILLKMDQLLRSKEQ